MKRTILVSVSLALLALLLAGVLAATLVPRIVTTKLAGAFAEDLGLALAPDTQASLSLAEGLAVTLQDVALTSGADQAVPVLSAREMTVPLSWNTLVSGGLPGRIILEDAVFALTAANTSATGTGTPEALRPRLAIELRNSALKVSNTQGTVITATDINGQILREAEGGLLIDARGLFNGLSTQLTATFDDVNRLNDGGSPADIAVTSGAHGFSFSGRAKLPVLALDGTASLQSPDVAALLVWLGWSNSIIAANTNLTLDGPLSSSATAFIFPKLDLALGRASGTGALSIDIGSTRPVIDAMFEVDVLNLRDLQSRPEPLAHPWSEQPWDVAALTALDGKLRISAAASDIGALTTGPATLTAESREGATTFRYDSPAVAGGAMTVDLTLATAEGGTLATLKLATDKVDAQTVLAALAGVTQVAGPLTLSVDVAAAGQNTAALMSSLKGKASLSMSDGVLTGLDLGERLAASATGSEGWTGEGGSNGGPVSLRIDMTLDDGVARLSNSAVLPKEIELDLSGQIDILRQAFDLEAKPRGTAALPPVISIKGPWTKPRFALPTPPAVDPQLVPEVQP